MLILLETSSTDEHEKHDYDYAVVKLEAREAQILAGYMGLFRVMKTSQPELIEMTFIDADVECEFYPNDIFLAEGENLEQIDTMPEKIREDLDKKGWTILPEDFFPEFSPRDAHCPDRTFVICCENGFYWEALPPNTLIKIDTQMPDPQILSQLI